MAHENGNLSPQRLQQELERFLREQEQKRRKVKDTDFVEIRKHEPWHGIRITTTRGENPDRVPAWLGPEPRTPSQ